jgi:hypothetical protein
MVSCAAGKKASRPRSAEIETHRAMLSAHFEDGILQGLGLAAHRTCARPEVIAHVQACWRGMLTKLICSYYCLCIQTVHASIGNRDVGRSAACFAPAAAAAAHISPPVNAFLQK